MYLQLSHIIIAIVHIIVLQARTCIYETSISCTLYPHLIWFELQQPNVCARIYLFIYLSLIIFCRSDQDLVNRPSAQRKKRTNNNNAHKLRIDTQIQLSLLTHTYAY